MSSRTIFTFSLMALLWPTLLWAESGRTAAGFLLLEATPAAAGVAGANTGDTASIDGVFSNPASLRGLTDFIFSAVHRQHFQSIRSENFSAVYAKKSFVYGFSLQSVFIDGMEARQEPSAQPLFQFGSTGLAPAATVAYALGEHWSLGGRLKYIHHRIGSDWASSAAADLGACFSGGPRGMRAGAYLSHWGPGLKYSQISCPLPARLKAGLGYAFWNSRLDATADLTLPVKGDLFLSIGLKANPKEGLSLRLGYKGGRSDLGRLSGLSFGLGFKHRWLSLDYALSDYGALGFSHILSLSYYYERRLAPPAEVISIPVRSRVDSLLNSGISLLSDNNYRQAIVQFQKALQLDPRNQAADSLIKDAQTRIKHAVAEALNLCDQHMKRGKWNAALAEAERAVEMDPDSREAQQKKAQVVKSIREASEARTRQGVEYFNQEQYVKAEEEFKAALSLWPGNKEAKQYLERIVAIRREASQKAIDDLYLKGVNAYTNENYQEAINYWLQVLKLDPNHANAKRNIERAREKLKLLGE